VHRARYIASRVTAPDAELYAIHAAIVKACSLPNVNNITLFTDLIASARRAVNPSVHSGQGHSLAVCHTLEQWFANGSRSVTFVMVHSLFEWGSYLCSVQKAQAATWRSQGPKIYWGTVVLPGHESQGLRPANPQALDEQ